MRHVLDAWTVIEWLSGGEPARTRVNEILAAERPFMSWINLGEVSYVLSPRAGRKRSIEVAAQLRAGLDLDPATPERILHASAIKAQHRMSYADAFAVATALAHDAVLVTGDPEILAAGSVQQTEDVRRR